MGNRVTKAFRPRKDGGMMNIQRHNVEDMSPQEIRLNLYITQLIIIGIGCLLAYILFQDVKRSV